MIQRHAASTLKDMFNLTLGYHRTIQNSTANLEFETEARIDNIP